jgi:sugar/nucleoside kinase (ribokinase family)
MTPLHVVTVGHVTNDTLADGVHPGGAALYSGLAAHALGAEVTVVTRAGPDFVGHDLLEQVDHRVVLPAPRTTAFDERYADGRRTVRLLARAAPLDAPLPPADVLLLCPVADEVPASALGVRPRRLLAAGLQGWLRNFGPDGTAAPRPRRDAEPFAGCGLVTCSSEDLAGLGPETLALLRATVPRVVVTEGATGARVYAGGEGYRVAALPVDEVVDPTGAGDVFLAALAIQLARGSPLLESAAWAACAGALTVSAPGPAAVARLEGLGAALERYRRVASPPRRLRPGE